MSLVEFGKVPFVAEYLARVLVQPLALAHMEVGGAAAKKEVLDDAILAETVGDDRMVVAVLTKLNLLFVKPYVETEVAFLKFYNIKVVYQHIREDGSK